VASAQETLTPNDENKVQIAFFLHNRVWSGVGKAWNLNDYEDYGFTLNCREGERICYGAWVRGDLTARTTASAAASCAATPTPQSRRRLGTRPRAAGSSQTFQRGVVVVVTCDCVPPPGAGNG
jgi:hypothetical protein